MRVLEVQRTRRSQLAPAQQAVTSAFSRLNMLALPPARPSKSAEGDAPEEPKQLEAPLAIGEISVILLTLSLHPH